MDEQEQTIDLRVILKVLLEHLIPIALAAVIAAGVGFTLAGFIIPKQYTASAMLYVENSANKNEDSAININDISAAQKIVNTCQILFTNDYVMGQLSESLGGEFTTGELKKMISIESKNSTEILEISVKCGSPELAKRIVDRLVELSIQEFKRIIRNGSIDIVSQAKMPAGHTYPSVTMFTLVGFAIGLFGSFFIFLIIEILDSKVKADDDLTSIYEIPVFAEIMDFEAVSKSGYGKYGYSKYGYSRYGYYDHHHNEEEESSSDSKKKKKKSKKVEDADDVDNDTEDVAIDVNIADDSDEDGGED